MTVFHSFEMCFDDSLVVCFPKHNKSVIETIKSYVESDFEYEDFKEFCEICILDYVYDQSNSLRFCGEFPNHILSSIEYSNNLFVIDFPSEKERFIVRILIRSNYDGSWINSGLVDLCSESEVSVKSSEYVKKTCKEKNEVMIEVIDRWKGIKTCWIEPIKKYDYFPYYADHKTCLTIQPVVF